MSALYLSHILCGLMEIFRKKWQESHTLQWMKSSESWKWTVIVTWSQKMIIFLPDGDDFVVENGGEAVLDEPVFVHFKKKVWKVFVY